MYKGKSQRAVRRCDSSRHSTTPTWNWCGSVSIANAPSRISVGKPLAPPGSGVDATTGNSGMHATKTPSASIAPSLSSDSTAIAITRPRLCSASDARRVPNSIANSPIAKATYSALSCQGAGEAGALPLSSP